VLLVAWRIEKLNAKAQRAQRDAEKSESRKRRSWQIRFSLRSLRLNVIRERREESLTRGTPFQQSRAETHRRARNVLRDLCAFALNFAVVRVSALDPGLGSILRVSVLNGSVDASESARGVGAHVDGVFALLFLRVVAICAISSASSGRSTPSSARARRELIW